MMVEKDAFTVGKDIGISPGAVVYRTEVFELIQYQPATPSVYRYPLLVVPPMINKFYIADIAPGRSMMEYYVSQGHQVFILSWRNPDQRARHWDLNTYGDAVVNSMAVAREISKAPKVNIMGLCAGGILSSMVLAHLSDTGQLDQISSLTLGVTIMDMKEAGTAVALMDTGIAKVSELASRARGYMDGRSLAEVFAWLRPDDLIWTYWVNNYLQGKKPPPFDILYWNADTTRMPAALHAQFVEFGMNNALTKPGASSMLGSPVDFSKIDLDTYIVAAIDDHISPWHSAYQATQLLGGNKLFVLSNSGHIAAMVNPPTNPKATLRVGTVNNNPPDHNEWLAQAETVQGSWWPHYTAWLAERAGDQKQAPKTLGSPKFRPMEAAPGTYVLAR